MIGQIMAGDPEYFLVEVKIRPTSNIKVFLDGDAGISIEKCVQYNRALYKKIEEAELFPGGDFSLEVSSPGLDEPLKLFRQYRKNLGRPVEVVLLDGTRREGVLREVSQDGIIVEETRGKNKKKGTDSAYFFIHPNQNNKNSSRFLTCSGQPRIFKFKCYGKYQPDRSFPGFQRSGKY